MDEDKNKVVSHAAGVQLYLSKRNVTGYRGVRRMDGRFQAQYQGGGKNKHLGMFQTAVEAAVAFAKYAQSINEEDIMARHTREVARDMASDDDEDQDEEETAREKESVVEWAAGMQLHLSKLNSTGYRGVVRNRNKFTAKHKHAGKYTHIGMFDTAVEAAFAFAKYVEALGLYLEVDNMVENHDERASDELERDDDEHAADDDERAADDDQRAADDDERAADDEARVTDDEEGETDDEERATEAQLEA